MSTIGKGLFNKLNLVTTKIKETSGPMITPKQQFLTMKKFG